MKVNFNLNGSTRVVLKPETNIEKLIMQDLFSMHDKGKILQLSFNDDIDEYTLALAEKGE